MVDTARHDMGQGTFADRTHVAGWFRTLPCWAGLCAFSGQTIRHLTVRAGGRTILFLVLVYVTIM